VGWCDSQLNIPWAAQQPALPIADSIISLQLCLFDSMPLPCISLSGSRRSRSRPCTADETTWATLVCSWWLECWLLWDCWELSSLACLAVVPKRMHVCMWSIESGHHHHLFRSSSCGYWISTILQYICIISSGWREEWLASFTFKR
jgi:hypothetical protein